ncbi:MAG: helix-turn-helix domain-containing protein [Planctomycetaceae bacterium]|nr:helix-turn-helix domain-containing protein [Planctomycetaceae bacterium]
MKTIDIRQQFGDRVRLLRKEQELSQEKLAFITGLHRTYLGSVERGERNISLQNIQILAKAFGITISVLMEGLK